MRGLRKYLTPFAPDQSGAVSVLYELGGIIVICDAGGCAGNVCGFDEPRWFEQKSAVFSAGLRDMDAILGRDDRLVAKLVDAAEKVEAGFAAIVGTPVPAVIGTDHQALRRMCEKKTDLPVLAVNTNGMELYDAGERKAYLELFKAFAREKLPVEAGKTGVLGMTPQDVSDLKDIENVKGDETFAQGADGALTWQADGNDIYYQGTTDKELPIDMKMTYYLDGKEISPEDLAGKSGKVKIRIDYTNNSSRNAKINGKKETIYTPFMMATGMIFPTDTFTNVEVTNGKVISDGNNNIVLGIGFPGLYDSLKLGDLDSFKDKESPDYVEITADVEDFSLALTATVATTGTLNELGLDDIDDLDDLQDSLDKLTESSTALVEGSRALQEGIQELDSSADTLVDGLNSADDGAGQLKDGIDTMNNSKGTLISGIDKLVAGMESLGSGAGSLQSGVNSRNQTERKTN